MDMEALPLWRELQAEAGEPLLVTVGEVEVGGDLREQMGALESCGAAFEVVDGAEASRRYPALRFDPDEQVLYQPDGAMLATERSVTAFVRSAVRHGAELRTRAPALGLTSADAGVEVRLDGETIRAAVVVVTAGGWARALLAGAGIDLPARTTAETATYFPVRTSTRSPVLVEWTEPISYGLPTPAGGLKTGEHRTGPDTDPDRPPPPDPASVQRQATWVARRYRDADPTPERAETCLYTNVDEERFVLERHGPVVVGSPCSGHGFKFAPLIGERLADLVG
jgi:sarcosine oxidase